jgi:hypothetical protein
MNYWNSSMRIKIPTMPERRFSLSLHVPGIETQKAERMIAEGGDQTNFL